MFKHSVFSIKKAAKRVLGQYFLRCVLATFLTGLLIVLIFNYVLDGTLQIESAFDMQSFYSAVISAKSPDEIIAYINNTILSIKENLGSALYAQMLKKFVLAIVMSSILQFIYRIFVVYPFQVGNCRFYLDSYSLEPQYKQLICGFTGNYLNVVKILLFRQIKVFLWSLLFIVPGIIKNYDTFMIPYLLADNPDINYKDAFEESSRMMNGNKLNLFWLNLSFIGWFFLATLTNGIAYIAFVGPYYDAALANIALRIKAEGTPSQANPDYLQFGTKNRI